MEIVVAAPRKSREAWMEAALRALDDGGVDAIRVERLARSLGVTKGSFYWHFEDRAALLEAIVTLWESSGTAAIIEETEARGGDARARIRRLWAKTSSSGRLGAELALRDWARHDPAIAARVQTVDDERMRYLRGLFAEISANSAAAEERAMLMYSLLIGNYFIAARHGRRSRKRVLDDSIEFLLRDVDG